MEVHNLLETLEPKLLLFRCRTRDTELPQHLSLIEVADGHSMLLKFPKLPSNPATPATRDVAYELEDTQEHAVRHTFLDVRDPQHINGLPLLCTHSVVDELPVIEG